jgi:uncharacterized protein (TIGR03083 family)
MLTQAIDYRDECDALYALLAEVDAARWSRPTQFKRWTLDDVLGHLHMFDYAARLTLDGRLHAHLAARLPRPRAVAALA